MLQDSKGLCSDYELDDYIFILAGASDVNDGFKLNERKIFEKLQSLSHTNVIILSIPQSTNIRSSSRQIYTYNYALYNTCNRLKFDQSIQFGDINYVLGSDGFLGERLHMSSAERMRVCQYIEQVVHYLRRTGDGMEEDDCRFGNLVPITLTDQNQPNEDVDAVHVGTPAFNGSLTGSKNM